jgi:protein-tyrosine sulfotransferase
MALFLVTGARRTGTTLLYSVLCSDSCANPLIAEAQLLTRLVEAYRWGNVNFPLFGTNYFDDPEQHRQFHAHFAAAFVAQTLRRFAPASNLVLKNPELAPIIDDVLALLPEAKVIVSVRDPRDQVVSERDTDGRQVAKGLRTEAEKRDVATIARTCWAYYAPVLHAAERDPGRFLFLRYEDLVRHTDDAIRGLREFTGMTFAQFDRSADWARVELDWQAFRELPSFTPLYGRKINETRIGRYREALTAPEVEAVNEICRPLIERFGYGAG